MRKRGPGRPTGLAPELAVLASTLLWGTLWIPVRQLHEPGANGTAGTALGLLVPLLVLLPAALRHPARTLRGVRAAWRSGFWLALGIALYAEGVARGRVAAVVLLFYLTPVWSILLARVALGQPITARRLATVGLGLAGLGIVFGGSLGAAAALGTGEWMGLCGGVAWSLALVAAHREAPATTGGTPAGPFERVFTQFLFLAPVFLAVAALPGGPGLAELHATSAWRDPARLARVSAFALGWMLPVVWLTVFAASRVDPGRFSILLMLEIVVGLGTAGLLTDEPLGVRELAGAALVLSAVGAEAWPATSPGTSGPRPGARAAPASRPRER